MDLLYIVMGNVIRIVMALVLALAAWTSGPTMARACACGAVITKEAIPIDGEVAVVRYHGGRETIDMSMHVTGPVADAAWIMPVPRGTEVSLGRANFKGLYEATKPEERHVYDWWPRLGPWAGPENAGAPAGAAVQVDDVRNIGPFEVTTLSATDPSAVGAWLTEHGYSQRDDLDGTFAEYLARDYQILAVKLLPSSGQSLDGDLAPLRMSFDAEEPIYPILLSRHAPTTQFVRLYLVADHKMTVVQEASPSSAMTMKFSGALPETTLDPSISLEEESTVYVTVYEAHLSPERIEADYVFAQAGDDEPYREVVEVTVYRGDVTLAILAGVGLIASAAFAVWASVRTARAREPRR